MSAAFYPKLNILQLSAPRKKKTARTLSAKKDAQHTPGILKNPALPFRTIEKIHQPLEKKRFADNCYAKALGARGSLAPPTGALLFSEKDAILI